MVNQLRLPLHGEEVQAYLADDEIRWIFQEDNTSLCNWLMRQVLQIFPSTDAVLRTTTIKTLKGIIQRPIRKLFILPIGYMSHRHNFVDVGNAGHCTYKSASVGVVLKSMTSRQAVILKILTFSMNVYFVFY